MFEKKLTNGSCFAAFLSASLGMLALSLVNLGTELSNNFKTTVHSIGKLWMPGAEGIGPYSGKETISALVWLLSWLVLYLLLRKKEVNSNLFYFISLFIMGLAFIILWPPVFQYISH